MVNAFQKNTGRRFVSCIAASMLGAIGFAPLAHGVNDYAALNTATQMVSHAEKVKVGALDFQARTQTINSGWKFILGEQSGAQNLEFDDSAWRNVDLPHDYSIEQQFTKAAEAESGYLLGGIGWYRKTLHLPQELQGKRVNLNFDGIYMDATIYLNGKALATHPYGYTPFAVDVTDAVKFGQENILAVRVNHQTPSSRWYSGSGIYRDVDLVITNPVHIAYNGVKVTAKNLEKYSESGTLPVAIQTTLENESQTPQTLTVKHTLKSKADGTVLGTVSSSQKLNPGETKTHNAQLDANSPKLWSLTQPSLYLVTTEISADTQVLDTVETVTGFRKTAFDPNTGFSLNGVRMKLKGVSMHHDQGALGAKAYRRAIERQIEILQEMGVNTIRVTHNPASRDLVELANEKGMLLIEEIFDGLQHPKNQNRYDYARFFKVPVPQETKLKGVSKGSTWAQFDLESTLRRDFNAPSVIMWSLGNEIGEGTSYADMRNYVNEQADLIRWAKAVDDTRPVTRGDNQLKSNSSSAKSLMDSLVKAGGTAGLNYAGGNMYDRLHKEYPHWPIYGAETASAVNSRGVYHRSSQTPMVQTLDKQLTSYDASKVSWGAEASDAWYEIVKRDHVAGTMVWTGFDYIGEPTFWNGITAGAVGSWPSPKNSYFGIIDTAGFPKDSYYFYQSQWNDRLHTLHILPAWNADVVEKKGPEKKVPVVVYTDARKVELYFTPTGGQRKLIGTKEFTEKTTAAGYKYQIFEGEGKNRSEHKNLYLTWEVPYEDGALEAVGYDANGVKIENTVGRNVVQTAGAAAKLAVKVDRNTLRADNEDLAYLDVTITDTQGVPVPNAQHVVTFKATGQCSVMGTDNGEQADHTSYLSPSRKAFAGKVLGIVKSTHQAGECQVTVSAPGLPSQTLTLQTQPVKEAQQTQVAYYEYPRNYYVQLGQQPTFPAKVNAVMLDGSTQETPVEWGQVSQEQIAHAGNFVVQGATELGDKISANVTMLDTISAVLNYSAVTALGRPHPLPKARPAVLPDGQVLSTSFPVQWEEPAEQAYQQLGVVEIPGVANVFGKEIKVKATIRVAAEQVSVGKNLAPDALSLTQSVVAEQQSDTLTAVKDGKVEVPAYGGGGANPNVWTNYRAAQAGTKTADLIFGYATQQRFAEFGVYFYQDSWSARYPDAGTTKFYVSESAAGPWTEVPVTEAKDAAAGNVMRYNYTLAKPVTATFVKLSVSAPETDLGNRKPCVGISEVLLKGAESGGVNAFGAAQLTKLQVNGENVPDTALTSWKYLAPTDKISQLEFTAKDNAAVTVLPAHNGVVRLVVESEDQQLRKIFQIVLTEAKPGEATDSANMVPGADAQTTPGGAAPSQPAGENPPVTALDAENTPQGNAAAPSTANNSAVQNGSVADNKVDNFAGLNSGGNKTSTAGANNKSNNSAVPPSPVLADVQGESVLRLAATGSVAISFMLLVSCTAVAGGILLRWRKRKF